ncbi:MAG: PQQ-dependent sugar dehydrogenase [Rhodobacteraceae bacterium]|nr:PQQ-dependent sugar dehydrogenase [Paracoccaceae bacterium]
MLKHRLVYVVIACFSLVLAQAGWSGSLKSAQGDLQVTVVTKSLSEPWGLAFLTDGGFLVTERGGKLLHFDAAGNRHSIRGVPSVFARGQGGLLDIVAARDFATSREVFLTYSKRVSGGAGTALAVAKLSDNNKALTNLRVLFEMDRGSRGGRHFGSRVVEDDAGNLFLTIGERGQRDLSQLMGKHHGKTIRIARNGDVPADNPFAETAGALPEIWSLGHRNAQGAALDDAGRLWVVEHGPKGGDEINLVQRGQNYGWPVIGYGEHYNGDKIGIGTKKEGMEQPAHYWDPSIAPSGMMIYSGKLWPEWKGDIFVGSLKFDHIARLDRNDITVKPGEKLAGDETKRVRDVREAPDGSIWFLSVGNGTVYRIAP